MSVSNTNAIPASSSKFHMCKKGCDKTYSQSENYHNRLHHQDTLSIRRSGEDFAFIRDPSTQLFSCLCAEYTTQDPERLRVCVHLKIFSDQLTCKTL